MKVGIILLFGLAMASSIACGDWAKYEAMIKEEALKNEPVEQHMRNATRMPWSCSADSLWCQAEEPKSVHSLPPCWVKVVGAVGDSLTAANGALATTIIGLMTEYRGHSWAMGGVEQLATQTTAAGLLRKHSPNLYGYSTGSGKYTHANAKFNLAVPGERAQHMPRQVTELIDRIKADPRVNFEKDWKVVTLFIGGNDLCDYCSDKVLYSAENYVGYIREALDILHKYMPRTYVNFVTTLNVLEILHLTGATCRNMQKMFCDCALAEANYDELSQLVKDYHRVTHELIDTHRYETRDDFTVQLHPFMEQMTVPMLSNGKPDYSYFAPDCFHFSSYGHEAAGIELWNAMITNHGEKPDYWEAFGKSPKCLEKGGFFKTHKNSGKPMTKQETLREKLRKF